MSCCVLFYFRFVLLGQTLYGSNQYLKSHPHNNNDNNDNNDDNDTKANKQRESTSYADPHTCTHKVNAMFFGYSHYSKMAE